MNYDRLGKIISRILLFTGILASFFKPELIYPSLICAGFLLSDKILEASKTESEQFKTIEAKLEQETSARKELEQKLDKIEGALSSLKIASTYGAKR